MKLGISALFLLVSFWQGFAVADDLTRIRAMLKLPESRIDLGRAKLTIDKMVDPSVDIKANLNRIDKMVAEINAMLPGHASSSEKLSALRAYVYSAGNWNSFQVHSYDLDDPLGQQISHKLLTHYLDTRKGNCVSMPLLFVILGQRLGLDVTVALAPMHIFVKYRDETGGLINLETTSGASPARDVWIRQQIPMTDEAIANGIYLRALSKKETVAVMVYSLIEHYMRQHKYEEAINASDLVLEYSPRAVDAMLHKGAAYARLIKEQFISKYPTPTLIPAEKRPEFDYLDRNNRLWYAKAEALGWREPTQDNEKQYSKTIDRAKAGL